MNEPLASDEGLDQGVRLLVPFDRESTERAGLLALGAREGLELCGKQSTRFMMALTEALGTLLSHHDPSGDGRLELRVRLEDAQGRVIVTASEIHSAERVLSRSGQASAGAAPPVPGEQAGAEAVTLAFDGPMFLRSVLPRAFMQVAAAGHAQPERIAEVGGVGARIADALDVKTVPHCDLAIHLAVDAVLAAISPLEASVAGAVGAAVDTGGGDEVTIRPLTRDPSQACLVHLKLPLTGHVDPAVVTN